MTDQASPTDLRSPPTPSWTPDKQVIFLAALARRATPPSAYMTELTDEELASRIEMFEERERVAATAPEGPDWDDRTIH